MITLFRKIRQKLIDSGSVTKYLLYALGEILLVIIGIVIALQVNNMNERAKESAIIDKILLDMREELVLEIEYMNSLIRTNFSIDSLQADFLISNYTPEDLELNKHNNVDNLANLAPGANTSRNAYQSLMDNKSILPQELDSLLIRLDVHYVADFEELKTFEKIVEDFAVSYIDYRREHFEWFGLADRNSPASNEYFANDWRHRNNIVFHRRMNNAYVDAALYYRESALEVYRDISTHFDLNPLPDLPYLKAEYLDQFEGSYTRADESDSTILITISRDGNNLQLIETNNSTVLRPLDEMRFYVRDNSARYFEFRNAGDNRLHLIEDKIGSFQMEREYQPVQEDE